MLDLDNALSLGIEFVESQEVVLTAVQHTGMALCYASHTLQDDIEAHQTWQSMICVDGQVMPSVGRRRWAAGYCRALSHSFGATLQTGGLEWIV